MEPLKSCIGNAEMFPILKYWDFFNHAGVSPLPRQSAHALIDFAIGSQTHSYMNSGWFESVGQTRIAAATLLHCQKEEIAFIKSTGEGLSIVANAVDFKPGQRIVTTNVEYPANIYPWMDAAARTGAQLVLVPEEMDAGGHPFVALEKIIEAAAVPNTRLVALSHVEFASGQRHDLAAIGKFCRRRGILLCVDAIQSVGAVPLDVHQMQIDYLAAGGQKWLLGPDGTGVFFCRKELLASTRPLTVGWMNVVNAANFDQYDFTLRPDAGRFECGGLNIGGLQALNASLDLLNSLGMEAVSQRIKAIGDHLAARVEAKGYHVASPRDGNQWSGIVSLKSPVHAAEPIAARMRKEHRIEIMVRQGRLRVSPHFYNTEAQIDRLVELLPSH